MNKEQWTGFNKGRWAKHIDVRNFIQTNYTEYAGDANFLESATEDTE